jgi:hypothetical protein
MKDTQNTIETLRAEFDILVKELLQYKSKEENKTGQKSGINQLNLKGKVGAMGKNPHSAQKSLPGIYGSN